MSTSATIRPTTTVSVLRTPEGTVDSFGDPVDNATTAATGVPMSIIQQGVNQHLPADDRLTNTATHTARARGDVDVEPADRIRDERTDRIYLVEGITRPQDPLGAAAIRIDLRYIGPTLP